MRPMMDKPGLEESLRPSAAGMEEPNVNLARQLRIRAHLDMVGALKGFAPKNKDELASAIVQHRPFAGYRSTDDFVARLTGKVPKISKDHLRAVAESFRMGISRRTFMGISLLVGAAAVTGLGIGAWLFSSPKAEVPESRAVYLFGPHGSPEDFEARFRRLEELERAGAEIFVIGEERLQADTMLEAVWDLPPPLDNILDHPDRIDLPEFRRPLEEGYRTRILGYEDRRVQEIGRELKAGADPARFADDPELLYLAQHRRLKPRFAHPSLEALVSAMKAQLAFQRALRALYRQGNEALYLREMATFYREQNRSDELRDQAVVALIRDLMRQHPRAVIVVIRGTAHASLADQVPHERFGFQREVIDEAVIDHPVFRALEPHRQALMRGDPIPQEAAVRAAVKGEYPWRVLVDLLGKGSVRRTVEAQEIASRIIDRAVGDGAIDRLTADIQRNAHRIWSAEAIRRNRATYFHHVFILVWLKDNGYVDNALLGRMDPALNRIGIRQLTIPLFLRMLEPRPGGAGGLEEPPGGLEEGEVSAYSIDRTLLALDRFYLERGEAVIDPALALFGMGNPRLQDVRDRLAGLLAGDVPSVRLQMTLSSPDTPMDLDLKELWELVSGRRDRMSVRWRLHSGEVQSLEVGPCRLSLADTGDRPFLAAELQALDPVLAWNGLSAVADEPIPEGIYRIAVRLAAAGLREGEAGFRLYFPKALLREGTGIGDDGLAGMLLVEALVEVARQVSLAQRGLFPEEAGPRAELLRSQLQSPAGPLGRAGFEKGLAELFGPGGLRATQEGALTRRLRTGERERPTAFGLRSVFSYAPHRIVDFMDLLHQMAHDTDWIGVKQELEPHVVAIQNSLAAILIKNRFSGASLGAFLRFLKQKPVLYGTTERPFSYFQDYERWARISIAESLLRRDEQAASIGMTFEQFREIAQEDKVLGRRPRKEQEDTYWSINFYRHLRSEHAHLLDHSLMDCMLPVSVSRAQRELLTEYQDFLEQVTAQLSMMLAHQFPLSLDELELVKKLGEMTAAPSERDTEGHRLARELISRVFPDLIGRAHLEGMSLQDVLQTLLWFKMLLLTTDRPREIEGMLFAPDSTADALRDCESYLREKIREAVMYPVSKELQTEPEAVLEKLFLQDLLRELVWVREHHSRTGHFPWAPAPVLGMGEEIPAETPPAQPPAGQPSAGLEEPRGGLEEPEETIREILGGLARARKKPQAVLIGAEALAGKRTEDGIGNFPPLLPLLLEAADSLTDAQKRSIFIYTPNEEWRRQLQKEAGYRVSRNIIEVIRRSLAGRGVTWYTTFGESMEFRGLLPAGSQTVILDAENADFASQLWGLLEALGFVPPAPESGEMSRLVNALQALGESA